MPFPESLRQREIKKAKKCGACPELLPKGAYVEVHSATSLHLVLDENDPTRYIITDPPEGHSILKGKTISVEIFPEGIENKSDAICLCPVCHDEIHRSALLEAKRDKGFNGKIASPHLLKEVTVHFVKRGRHLVYELR